MESSATGASPDRIARDFDSALQIASDCASVESVFVIGGGSVYAQAIQHEQCSALHVTQIQSRIKCDTFFPEHPSSFKLWSEGQSIRCGDHRIRFKCYVRCDNHQQLQHAVPVPAAIPSRVPIIHTSAGEAARPHCHPQ